MKNLIALIITGTAGVTLYCVAQLHAEPKAHEAKVEWGYSGETGPDKWG